MGYKIDYKNTLNTAQYQAATTIDGPVLIIAGAGTGKTFTLVNRVAYMIENGIAPESILLLTFTNAAADEMKLRANNILDERCSKIHASTYHSFCTMMLRKYAKYTEFSNDFTIISQQDVKDAIRYVKAKNNIYKTKNFPNVIKIAKIFSGAINNNQTIKEYVHIHYNECSNYISELNQLYLEFQAYKKSRDMMDYDDILIYFYELIKNPIIQNKISNQFNYIMVDEYQDTNDLQEKIILKLRENNKNIAVVGDDYQSIYGFRGSNVNNFIDFPNKFPGCKRVSLTVNYRSSQEILDFANKVMSIHAHFGFPKNMKSYRGTLNKKVNLWNGDNETEEANFIINEIIKNKENGGKYNDIAIIERKSRHSLELEALLTEKGIPYDKKGGLKLLDRTAIMDMLAFLRVFVNFKDELAWFRILQLLPGIGDTYARNISSLALVDNNFLINNPYKKRFFYDGLVNLNDFVNNMRSLTDTEDNAFEKQYDGFINFYYNLRHKTIEGMDLEDEDTRKAYFKVLNEDKDLLIDFKPIAMKYKTIINLLDALLTDNLNQSETEEDRITITTIHSAKGLEYNIVFVLNCLDEVFPSTSEAEENTEADNEELRCFYVAITRAKNQLYIMVPNYVIENGNYHCVPSHYLNNFSQKSH